MTNLYDDPTLLRDPDYTKSVCGIVIHVDDVDDHGNDDIDPCERCEGLDR